MNERWFLRADGAARASIRRRARMIARGAGGIAWASALIFAGAVRGQTPSAPEAPDLAAPFSARSAVAQAAGETGAIWETTLAERAVEAGFYSVAENLFRAALARREVAGAQRDRLALGLMTAVIAQGKTAAAEQEVENFTGERNSAWLLRRMAVDFLKEDFAALQSRLEQMQPDALPGAEQSWYYFLRAMALDRAGERERADVAFDEAYARSSSQAERAIFRLAQTQARLNAGQATDGMAANLRRQMTEYQGQRVSYQWALQYAVVLDRLGRDQEAIDVLRRQRDTLPSEEVELRDQTLLTLGLVAGAATPAGRAAYRELLTNGADPELQRVALLRLAAGAPAEGGPSATGLQQFFDELLAREPPHPLTEDLLLFSAELALRNRGFEKAEGNATALLSRFPGSSLRRNALALLARSSWQRQRYRIAADYVTKLRAEPGATAGESASLAVLLAECHYRAGMQDGTAEDFRNAAEAYAQAENAPGVSAGTIFFQRVLASIRAGDVAAAIRLLDTERTRTDGVDLESIWQAEWNLARFLQIAGRNAEAFQRVESLRLAIGVPAELRLRFLWLGAQLSREVGRPAETPQRVAAVLDFLNGAQGAGIAADLRAEVASNAALVAAQASLDTGDADAGLQAMEKLRADFPGSRAAVYSYIVQARYLAAKNQLVAAQQMLVDLAGKFPQSEYAPLALYEAALQAAGRGQDTYLREATELLETLADKYPQESYYFPARLKQADVLRRLNEFAAAEQIYQRLENDYPNRPDRVIVQLSLADTLMAQAATDPGKFEAAVSRLERLTDLPSAPLDLRAEAGFKLGFGWQSQGDVEHAERVYWEVYERFLDQPENARNLKALGRHWVARALLALGQIEEKAGRLDNARRVYQAVLDHNLPGENLARGRLQRFAIGG